MARRSEGAARALARVPLFADLPGAELERLGGCLRARAYGRGEVIFLEGDPGTGLCIVESGLVKIVLTSPDGRERVLNIYGPGDFFGEFALLDGEPRSADALALVDCRTLWLRQEDFRSFLEQHPGAAASLLAILSRRLRHTTRLVQDEAFRDVPGRLARAILGLAASRGRPTPQGTVIEARLTQAELAGMVGATRETVNKCLGELVRRGALRSERGTITVLRPDLLEARADAP